MPWVHSLAVLATGGLAFWLAAQITTRVAIGPAAHQAVLKALLILFAFALIAVWRRRVPGAYGFTRSHGVRWSRVLGAGAALGFLASLILLLLGGRGMQSVLGAMKFWQIVLIVWIGSSVSEEIFTRGWAQGALERWSGVRAGAFSLPVLTSAVLFGSMHVPLFGRVDPITAAVVVIATTLLGLVAGRFRELYGGLGPAVAAHVSFNIGGMIGGIVYVIAYRIITGEIPILS